MLFTISIIGFWIVLSFGGSAFMNCVKSWLSPDQALSSAEWRNIEKHMGASVLKPPVLTQEQIDQYHELGYLKIAGYFDSELISAMRLLVDHINLNPSGLLKRANNGRFCGFMLHPFETVPEWRDVALRLPLDDTVSKLMNTNEVLYIQDIIHHTSPSCFPPAMNVTTGRMHSDGNQGIFSMNKKYNWGDNLAIAWIALDKLDYIDFQVYPRSHKWIDPYGNFTFDNFCRMDHDVRQLAIGGDVEFESHRVYMEPGDVLFFQGLTYHRVTKHRDCQIGTCRRVTIRYLDGEVSTWRDDLSVDSVWPYISHFTGNGKHNGDPITDTVSKPYRLDRRPWNGESKFGMFNLGGTLVPPIHHWLRFLIRIWMQGGLSGNDIIAQCPHSQSLPRSELV